MPYTISLRSTETQEITPPAADSLRELNAAAEKLTPEGFETTLVTKDKIIVQSTATSQITVETLDDYQAHVPEGWQPLAIR